MSEQEQRFKEIWSDAVKQFEASTNSKLRTDDPFLKILPTSELLALVEDWGRQAKPSAHEGAQGLEESLSSILTVVAKVSETVGEAAALVRIHHTLFAQKYTCPIKTGISAR
jgi:hypothetical protein